MIDWKNFFPEVKYKTNQKSQFKKVLEEVVEAEAEIGTANDRFLEEMIDIVHASFNTLYKTGYSNDEINQAIKDVVQKNYVRGKYND